MGPCFRRDDERVACENNRYRPLRFLTIGGTFNARHVLTAKKE